MKARERLAAFKAGTGCYGGQEARLHLRRASRALEWVYGPPPSHAVRAAQKLLKRGLTPMNALLEASRRHRVDAKVLGEAVMAMPGASMGGRNA